MSKQVLFSPLAEHSLGSFNHWKTARKRIKDIQFKAREIKLFMFANAINVFTENPPNSTNVLLELAGEFSKVTGY